MTTDTSNYYERDENGQWWIVLSGDFLADIKQKTKAPHSIEMEIAYEQGLEEGREQATEEIDAEDALK